MLNQGYLLVDICLLRLDVDMVDTPLMHLDIYSASLLHYIQVILTVLMLFVIVFLAYDILLFYFETIPGKSENFVLREKTMLTMLKMTVHKACKGFLSLC